MAKGLNTAKYAKDVKQAIDFAMAAYLNAAQGQLVRANPKDTGRMASSWNIAQNFIDTSTAPERVPGSQKVEVNTYNGKITADGTWFISNSVPYAVRVAYDPTWAKGGAGGAAWYTNITNTLPQLLTRYQTQALRRVK